jgi:hypothetical protein
VAERGDARPTAVIVAQAAARLKQAVANARLPADPAGFRNTLGFMARVVP